MTETDTILSESGADLELPNNLFLLKSIGKIAYPELCLGMYKDCDSQDMRLGWKQTSQSSKVRPTLASLFTF